jgi:hypothetical protein
MSADWTTLVATRVVPLIERMRAGEDVPPALWYRAEGALEALLASGAIDATQLGAFLEALFTDALGQGTQTLFDVPASAWIGADGSVRLRFRLPRAPVYPTGGGNAS